MDGMSYGMISGSEACFHNLCTKPNHPSPRKSITQNCPRLLLRTHLANPSISIRTPSGSTRTRTRGAIKSHLCPGAEAVESFYELLGIPESVTLPEIKKAYKQQALKYHPDVSPPERAEEYCQMFIRVREAYETLSDPNSRAVYDRDLAGGLQLAFSRTRSHHDQKIERDNWETQLMELRRRSANKDSMRGNNMPWGARMRRQRSE